MRSLLTCRHLVIVGQAPSRTSDPKKPLTGLAVRRELCRLLGVEKDEYLRLTRRFNLLNHWPGRSGGKGDRFDARVARARALRMMRTTLRFPHQVHVLFLGRKVAAAFEFDAPFLEWRGLGTTVWAATLPHPSGVNHWWNAEANRREARRFMRRLGRAVKGGETWPA